MKIILTGGGTAGHVWPIVAICQKLKNSSDRLLYVGSSNGLEEKISRDYGIPFKGVLTGKIRNYFSLNNFFDPFKSLFGLIQAFFIIVSYRPDVIFSKGGYVAFPLLFWAKIFNIPTIIHESDSILGKTNRWAAQFAQKVCLGFPQKFYHNSLSAIDQEKIVYTGIPIRQEFFENDLSIIKIFDRPVILITGGSQGASKINETIELIIKDLLEKYEIFHLSGEHDFKKLRQIENEHYHLFSFSNNIPQMMKQADLVITRAGSTLSEIAALGKASIIIPLPWASLDHQTANAKIFQEERAGEVIPEKNLTPEAILSIINRLMENVEYKESLGEHAKKLAYIDSPELIINLIHETKKK